MCADGPPTVSAGFNTSAGARGGMPHVSERNDRHAKAVPGRAMKAVLCRAVT